MTLDGTERSDGTGPFHIFGYGSLIWKPPPFVVKRQAGYIKGFTRRFAQSSHDHRGTPEAPGRVVTLVPSSEWANLPGADDYPSLLVWGVVYTIDPRHVKEVKEYLDVREKDGYEMTIVDVYKEQKGEEQLLTQSHVYVGHTSNPSFVGPEPLPKLAAHINQSVGPSGPNKEYLYNLNREVQVLCPGIADPYLKCLTDLVSSLDEADPSG